MKIFFLSLLLSFSTLAQKPTSCDIRSSTEESSFYNAVAEQISSGMEAGEFSPNVGERFESMKRIFQNLSNELCALDLVESAKSERARLVENAINEMAMVTEIKTGNNSEDKFIQLISGIFTRAMERL